MKINSRKFLVFSYAISGKPVLYTHLEYIWPDLSPGGRRGLIAYLLKQRLISVTYEGKQARFELTPIGRVWVEEEYFTKMFHEPLPGFLVLIYPDSDLSDPKVGKLRALLKANCTEVSNRVYFSSSQLSDEVLTQIKKRYFSHVAVAGLKEWLIGDQKLFENYYLLKKMGENSLSGVSNELRQLTDKKTTFLLSNHQSNFSIFSLLDRIFSVIDAKQASESSEINESLSARELLRRFSNLF